MRDFNFQVIFQDKKSHARVGVFETAHGIIETPTFVPVGTQATVKSLTPKDLEEIGVQIFFGNTYHLHLRPGEDVVKEFGGLAKFMGWKGATMTDSGGFQVFSLGSKKRIKMFENPEITEELVKITDDEVTFRSHLDGSLHTFTPEQSIQIQKKLGADIMLSFDECPAYPCSHEEAKAANLRTHTWALRSLKASQSKQYYKFGQGILGVVQGSVYQDLREESAKFIASHDFNGVAIGGVAVGESKREMRDVLKWVIPYLPNNKVRHLLGIGEVDDIFDAVEAGVDMFDCVIPSRLGRTGFVFVHPPEGKLINRFRIDINKSMYLRSKDSVDQRCSCYVCKTFTRGYLHHLFRTKELLAYRLATYHNIYFLTNLTRIIRRSIISGKFLELKRKWLQ